LGNIVFRPTIPRVDDPCHRDSVLSAMFLAKRFIITEYARRLVAEGGAYSPVAWLRHGWNVALGLPRLAGFSVDWMRRRNFATHKLPSVFLLRHDGNYPMEFNAEQWADPESRISLGRDVDPHGVPRLVVRWRAGERDLDSICRAFHVLRDAVGNRGLGEIRLAPDLPDLVRAAVIPQSGHHIGTVRMGDNPRTSVVDRDGEVWGTRGLFVAGTALFPTSGFANPTLTAVALAFRLAERLVQRPRQTDESVLTTCRDPNNFG
jgi:choline dehydrogenase-like flavoprotein